MKNVNTATTYSATNTSGYTVMSWMHPVNCASDICPFPTWYTPLGLNDPEGMGLNTEYSFKILWQSWYLWIYILPCTCLMITNLITDLSDRQPVCFGLFSCKPVEILEGRCLKGSRSEEEGSISSAARLPWQPWHSPPRGTCQHSTVKRLCVYKTTILYLPTCR